MAADIQKKETSEVIQKKKKKNLSTPIRYPPIRLGHPYFQQAIGNELMYVSAF